MAIRPVFIAENNLLNPVRTVDVNFEWFPGFAMSQKQKSIQSLHTNFNKNFKGHRVLEISSKSPDLMGVYLSVFNLKICSREGKTYSLESAFQSSKVFERGGPYLDLLNVSSKDAKQDSRLRSSGQLFYFQYLGRKWPLEPKTAFYDWLYITTVHSSHGLSKDILQYDAFTDIEFNPQKSINCQARSAALYVSLHQAGMLEKAVSSIEEYLEVLDINI